jgi:hypothetical protein
MPSNHYDRYEIGEVGKQTWRRQARQNTGNFNEKQLQENNISFLLAKCLGT